MFNNYCLNYIFCRYWKFKAKDDKIIRMKRIIFYVLVAIIISTSLFSFSAGISNAGSLGNASVFTSVIDSINSGISVVGGRISDIVYFVSMQSKYIFGGYKDPNAYQDWNASSSIDQTVNNLITRTQEAFSGKASTTLKVYPPKISNASPVIDPLSKNGALIKTNPTLPDISKIFLTNYSTTTVSSGPINVLDISTSNAKTLNGGNISSLDILLYTNNARLNNGLSSKLSVDTMLDKIAKMRLDDMFAKQYFEHNSPSGDSASVYAKQVGYEYILIGENLALGNFDGASDMVQAWMNSPGHRANIMNGEFTKLGVAVGTGNYQGRQVIIGVQIFSRPLALCNKPDTSTQTLIATSTESIKLAQAKAAIMVTDLEKIKNVPNVDWSYYNQKITEYNYFAKQINDSINALKILVDTYNAQVRIFNDCIKK